MKGASTVGTIFSSNVQLNQEFQYSKITKHDNGTFTIEKPWIMTQVDGDWYIILNVRGYETGYTDEYAYIEVSEKISVA